MVARSGKRLWRASKGIIWIIHHLHFARTGQTFLPTKRGEWVEEPTCDSATSTGSGCPMKILGHFLRQREIRA
jgi:hypothetical protein